MSNDNSPPNNRDNVVPIRAGIEINGVGAPKPNDNVVVLGGVTRLDLPVECILGAAGRARLQSVVVMGYTDEGEEYFAASYADGAPSLWLIERFKLKLLQITEDDVSRPRDPA